MKPWIRLSAAAGACLFSAAAVTAADIEAYGVLDTYIEAYSNGDGTTTRLSSGGASPSCYGLRGEEQLANGLKAFFALEGGILVDQGTSTPDSPAQSDYIFQRHAYVGLAGDFGRISFGYQYTPTFIALASMDPAGFSLGSAMGTFSSPTARGVNGGAASDLTSRSANAVSYQSPKLGNFVFTLFAGLGEKEKTANDVSSTRGNYYGGSARYMNGALTSVLAFGIHKAQFNRDADGHDYSGNDYQIDFAVNYDFGFVKPALNFAWKKGNDRSSGAAPAAFQSENIFVSQAGFSAPVAGGRWMASVAYARNSTTEDADALSAGTRYEYPLSKKTFVYTGAIAVWNEDYADYSLSGGGGSTAGIPTVMGKNASTFFAGINTRF